MHKTLAKSEFGFDTKQTKAIQGYRNVERFYKMNQFGLFSSPSAFFALWQNTCLKLLAKFVSFKNLLIAKAHAYTLAGKV